MSADGTLVLEGVLFVGTVVAALVYAIVAARAKRTHDRTMSAVDAVRDARIGRLVAHVREDAVRRGHEIRDSQCRYHDPMANRPYREPECRVCKEERRP